MIPSEAHLASVLAALGHAVEGGYAWSVYPSEAKTLLAEIERLSGERDDARRMLAECTVLSGADTDGNTVESGWVHLWSGAVEEVRQLRADYDDHSDIERAEREVDRLRGEVERERAAVVVWLRGQRIYGTDELLGQGFANVCGILSDAIENGEHRREETK